MRATIWAKAGLRGVHRRGRSLERAGGSSVIYWQDHTKFKLFLFDFLRREFLAHEANWRVSWMVASPKTVGHLRAQGVETASANSLEAVVDTARQVSPRRRATS